MDHFVTERTKKKENGVLQSCLLYRVPTFIVLALGVRPHPELELRHLINDRNSCIAQTLLAG